MTIPMQTIDAVPFHTIRAGKWVDFDLYAYDREQNLQKIVKKDQMYSAQVRNKLAQAKLTKLFIHSSEKEAYYTYLERNLKEMAVDRNVPLAEKTRALYDGSARILENIFYHPENGELHTKVKGIVQSAVDIVQYDPKAIKTLKEVSSLEYSDQTHSVDTAVISLGLGNHLGFTRNDLLKLGYAAIMHDIGKSRISNEILQKEGELDEEEFDLVKRHSLFGYFILRKQDVTTKMSWAGYASTTKRVTGRATRKSGSIRRSRSLPRLFPWPMSSVPSRPTATIKAPAAPTRRW